MSQLITSIDIEEQLQADLSAILAADGDTSDVSASPLPPNLGELPAGRLVAIRRIGGERANLVIDTHSVSVDVYAPSWAEAVEESEHVLAVISSLPYRNDVGIQYHAAYPEVLPYELPDTSNPILPRMRMSFQIITKAIVTEVE